VVGRKNKKQKEEKKKSALLFTRISKLEVSNSDEVFFTTWDILSCWREGASRLCSSGFFVSTGITFL
jgi:hypothetical protein